MLLLWLLPLFPVRGACCNKPGAGRKVGGRGNADEVEDADDVVGVLIFGTGLYMDTGPITFDRGAARSLTCGALPEGVLLLMFFKEGIGGNSPVGLIAPDSSIKPGNGGFIPGIGGRTAVALLFLVTCKKRPTMESIMIAKLAVISDFKISANPFNSGLMLTNFSAMSLFLPTVSANISLVIASLVALSC